MPSFNVVNYSLRPSKSIQRHIVFEGLRALQGAMGLSNQVYIGFGSIWFSDFVMAHKQLGISDMVSMEWHDVGFHRAKFNAPYATVAVKHGQSSELLPALIDDANYNTRPWVIWLDYDYPYLEAVQDDVRSVIENAPANTILLATVNGKASRYAQKFSDRPEKLRSLFGDVVPGDLKKEECKEDDDFGALVAKYALESMTGIAASGARPGGFVPAFRVAYQDQSPMITLGGVLPSPANAQVVTDAVNGAEWRSFPAKPIVVPHLTLREASILQAQLPKGVALTRNDVKALGFDLEDDQIEAFATYYREYPAFAQILA